MHIAFCDEADADGNEGNREFFIYGAIFLNMDRAAQLHTDIEQIRTAAQLAPTDQLKFHSRSRPQGMTVDAHSALKQQVLQAAHNNEVKFAAYIMRHEIARTTPIDTRIKFGANTVLQKFNLFLRDTVNDHGIVFFDRIPIGNPYDYLKEKFQIGLQYPAQNRRLERIVALASTTDGASHLSSVADIVVGGLRYCVNEPERDEAGRAIFPNVARLMWSRTLNGRVYVRETGLTIRPHRIEVAAHEAAYLALTQRLEGYLQPRR